MIISKETKAITSLDVGDIFVSYITSKSDNYYRLTKVTRKGNYQVDVVDVVTGKRIMKHSLPNTAIIRLVSLGENK